MNLSRILGYKTIGRNIPYRKGQQIQDLLVDLRLRNRTAEKSSSGKGGSHDIILFLEHSPTYTVGRAMKNTSLSSEALKLISLGADYVESSRGGKITFHGPGQLVIYPIIDLEALEIPVREYIILLQKLIVETCKRCGVSDATVTKDAGVWCEDRKICALGITVRRRVALHGLALNCNTDLSWFDHINPCGLNKQVTSIKAELARRGKFDLFDNSGPFDFIPIILECWEHTFNVTTIPMVQIDPILDMSINSIFPSQEQNLQYLK